MIQSEHITVTDFTIQDVDLLMAYWFDCPEEEIKKMAVLRSGMPDRTLFQAQLLRKIAENTGKESSKLNYLAIRLNSLSIGVHSVSNVIEGKSALFHAHIYQKSLRRMGVGKISYVKACAVFFQRFSLQYIEFNTPIKNEAPNSLKKSLGLRPIESIVLDRPHLEPGTIANKYILTAEQLNSLLRSETQHDTK